MTISPTLDNNDQNNHNDDDEWEPVSSSSAGNASAGVLDEQQEQHHGTDTPTSAATTQLGEDVQDILDAVEDILQKAEDNNTATVIAGEDLGSADVSDFFELKKKKSKATAVSTPQQRTIRKINIEKLRQRLKRTKQNVQKISSSTFNIQNKLVKPVAKRTVLTTRKFVTGSASTRVRDYVVLPRIIRVLDKYTFTSGVLGMLITEYVILLYPQYFRYYNMAVLVPMFTLRFVNYKRTKQQ